LTSYSTSYLCCDFLGSLTLTKIKDAFAIMKNIVLESRASSSSSSSGGGSKGGKAIQNDDGGGGGEGSEELMKKVKDLKSLVMQREKEIEILVNMVKKGKTSEDVDAVSRGSQRNGQSGGGADGDGFDDNDSRSGRSSGRGDNVSDGPLSGGKRLTTKQQQQQSFQSMQQQLAQQREAAKEERILKRHLFGVPPPTDQAIFDDAAGKTARSSVLARLLASFTV
jgi:hypothetical protein